MKARFRLFVRSLLERQLKRLIKRQQPKVVAVVGSVGKTSTKFAIEAVLSQKYRVQMQTGNYNDTVSVPLAAFGLTTPNSIINPFAWIWRLIAMEIKLWQTPTHDVLLLELGTDKAGEIPHFASYLKPDISVITAVAPEHMEYFGTLDAVAKEELAIAGSSKITIFGRDEVPSEYRGAHLEKTTKVFTYGLRGKPDLTFDVESSDPVAGTAGMLKSESKPIGHKVRLKGYGEPAIKSALAAALVGEQMGLTRDEIHAGLEAISTPSGRMQSLAGISGSLIIDDTYNSSPEAAYAALQALLSINVAGKHIAVMGSMNELGDESPRYHAEVGAACAGVDLLVTIGGLANDHLGPAAVAAGLDPTRWKPAESPYAAGEYLKLVVGTGDVVLAKGSQNGVFAEEAIKAILADPADTAKLVRQSPAWIRIKNKQFGVQ